MEQITQTRKKLRIKTHGIVPSGRGVELSSLLTAEQAAAARGKSHIAVMQGGRISMQSKKGGVSPDAKVVTLTGMSAVTVTGADETQAG